MSRECGYHYTSLACWKKIQRVGLMPYSIHQLPLIDHCDAINVKGIWIWLRRFDGLEHVGSVLYQMFSKGTKDAVLLSVMYNDEDTLHVKKQSIIIWHSGHLGNLQYHSQQHCGAAICTKVIPPEDIILVRKYNLLDVWNEKGKSRKRKVRCEAI